MDQSAQDDEENSSSKKRKAEELDNADEQKAPKKQKVEDKPAEKYDRELLPYKQIMTLISFILGKERKMSLHIWLKKNESKCSKKCWKKRISHD